MTEWIKIGDEELCICKECRWCEDVVIEGVEILCGYSFLKAEYAVSPLWYQREALRIYLEEEEQMRK